jgi:alpha-aminoadipic semialdehyde synthase
LISLFHHSLTHAHSLSLFPGLILSGGQRLVAFGKYAGICGMIDCFRGLGARLLALGFSSPFMGVASSYMYPSVADAQEAVWFSL